MRPEKLQADHAAQHRLQDVHASTGEQDENSSSPVCNQMSEGIRPRGVFIAEATALLKLVEAYTNEDGEQRKGIMLFLDMKKAFDRVSYDFTLSGLKFAALSTG